MEKWQRVTLITFSMVFMTLYSVNIIAEAKTKKKIPYNHKYIVSEVSKRV